MDRLPSGNDTTRATKPWRRKHELSAKVAGAASVCLLAVLCNDFVQFFLEMPWFSTQNFTYFIMVRNGFSLTNYRTLFGKIFLMKQKNAIKERVHFGWPSYRL